MATDWSSSQLDHSQHDQPVGQQKVMKVTIIIIYTIITQDKISVTKLAKLSPGKNLYIIIW